MRFLWGCVLALISAFSASLGSQTNVTFLVPGELNPNLDVTCRSGPPIPITKENPEVAVDRKRVGEDYHLTFEVSPPRIYGCNVLWKVRRGIVGVVYVEAYNATVGSFSAPTGSSGHKQLPWRVRKDEVHLEPMPRYRKLWCFVTSSDFQKLVGGASG